MRRIVFASLILLAACSTPVPIRFGTHMNPAPIVGVSNPSFFDGDAARGRQAFIKLRCIDCHRVAEDPGLPRGARAIAGPTIANMRRFSQSEVAQRIASRTTGESEELFDRTMKDYTQPITAQQLVDLVAYLRSAGAERE